MGSRIPTEEERSLVMRRILPRKTWIERISKRIIDPDLCRNATEYTNNHRNKYAVEIHFISLIKELHLIYIHNGNKLARVLVAYP